MPRNFLRKSLAMLMRRQTSILSAAFVIMATVILSQALGLIRQRLLVALFGASNELGIYLIASRLPDSLFQLIVAGALSSAFIPVFSDFLGKGEEKTAHKMASTLMTLWLAGFLFLSVPLFAFAQFFLQLMNPGSGFSSQDIQLMANLMRVIIFGQCLFIVGTFFSALLQSYNHFFIPGIAAALYNFGIIVGLLVLHSSFGIYAPAYGVVLGALFYILFQLPMVYHVGFYFQPSFSLRTDGVKEVSRLMWPRTFSIFIFQIGSLITIALVSFLPASGRSYAIFDYAQTLAFAPIALFGQTIAQAAFPVLSRQRSTLDAFKVTFVTSFTQMLYLILPVSVLFLVLRIPIVRLVYGASQFDWEATVLTGRTLAFFSIAMFAQALIYLVSRGFYALHDTKTPLVIGAITTGIMAVLGGLFVLFFKFGIGSIAIAYSIGGIMNLFLLMYFLDKKLGGFSKKTLALSIGKIFLATIFTGFALYIPIKLLDQLVFDTTYTINLIFLTGISSLVGLSLYVFLTWLFNVQEAGQFILIFKKIGNWREILGNREEVIDSTRVTP